MILEAPTRERPVRAVTSPAVSAPATLPERMMSQYKDQRDRAYQLLRRWLLSGRVQPGGRLRETEWAERLCVNRSAIREACGRLCIEGLIVEGPCGGYCVAEMTEQDVRDLHEIRAQLAALAAEHLCRPGRNRSEAVRCLWRAYEELEWILQKDYPILWAEAELRFYEILFSAAGSRHLTRLYRCVHAPDLGPALDEPTAWRQYAQATLADCKAAIAAIERGDAAEAARLLQAQHRTESVQARERTQTSPRRALKRSQ